MKPSLKVGPRQRCNGNSVGELTENGIELKSGPCGSSVDYGGDFRGDFTGDRIRDDNAERPTNGEVNTLRPLIADRLAGQAYFRSPGSSVGNLSCKVRATAVAALRNKWAAVAICCRARLQSSVSYEFYAIRVSSLRISDLLCTTKPNPRYTDMK